MSASFAGLWLYEGKLFNNEAVFQQLSVDSTVLFYSGTQLTSPINSSHGYFD
jgi:hypothetical protein